MQKVLLLAVLVIGTLYVGLFIGIYIAAPLGNAAVATGVYIAVPLGNAAVAASETIRETSEKVVEVIPIPPTPRDIGSTAVSFFEVLVDVFGMGPALLVTLPTLFIAFLFGCWLHRRVFAK